jgi:hypothetical protein
MYPNNFSNFNLKNKFMQRQLWLRDPKREVFLFRSPFVFVTDRWI